MPFIITHQVPGGCTDGINKQRLTKYCCKSPADDKLVPDFGQSKLAGNKMAGSLIRVASGHMGGHCHMSL
jgi:hypothetical protein